MLGSGTDSLGCCYDNMCLNYLVLGTYEASGFYSANILGWIGAFAVFYCTVHWYGRFWQESNS